MPGAVQTQLLDSPSLRPQRFGGAYSRPQQEALRGTMGQRIGPDAAGQRVLHAIQHNEFYVLTHAGERDAIKSRHARIEAAFDRAEAWEKAR